MVSIILTAWREAKTAGKAVREILEQIEDIPGETELILVCPDKETAADAFKSAVPVIDSAAGEGLIHKNKAARHKSRMNAHIKAM